MQGGGLDARNSLFSLPAQGVIAASLGSTVTVVNSNLGWTQDVDDAQGMFHLMRSRAVVQNSILEWQGAAWTVCLELPCDLTVDHSLVLLDSIDRALNVTWSQVETGTSRERQRLDAKEETVNNWNLK